MTQHFTVERPRRGRGKRDQFALHLPIPRVPGDYGIGILGVSESEIQSATLKLLKLHPRVAWVERINVGAGHLANDDGSKGRFMRFAFVGCSDIVGQLVTGQFLAVECKAYGKHPTYEQAEFLLKVIKNGGVGFVAHKPEDVNTYLSPDPWSE